MGILANYKCMFKRRRSCFCAFCKVPRKVYQSKNLDLIQILGLVGMSFVLTMVTWQHMDPRGLFFLGVMLLGGEIFSQVKWRQSMICNNCGFDPVLYLKSPTKAGHQIKEFLEGRSEKPEFLLKPHVRWFVAPSEVTRAAASMVPVRVSKPVAPNTGKNLSLRG